MKYVDGLHFIKQQNVLKILCTIFKDEIYTQGTSSYEMNPKNGPKTKPFN